MSVKIRMIAVISLSLLSSVALAGEPNGIGFVTQSIPAVSQAGLIALAFIVGILGAHLIRKSRNVNN